MTFRALAVLLLAATLSVVEAQRAFRDVDFSASCEVAEANMLVYDDVTSVYTCEGTAGAWFTVELTRLFYHEPVTVDFVYNSWDRGQLSRVVIDAEDVTMIFIDAAKNTLTQVYGEPEYVNPRYYSLTTLAQPDPETGISNRVLSRWYTADGATIELWAGVPPVRPEEAVGASIIIDRPNEDAWQF